MRVLVAAALTAIIAATGCSAKLTRHKASDGQCLEHRTDRIFGLAVNQDEYTCAVGR